MPLADGFPFVVFEHWQRVRPHHSHRWEELVVVAAGSARHEIRDEIGRTEKFALAAGDVFVVRPPASHAYQDCRSLRIYNVLFAPLDEWLPCHELGSLPGYHALFRLAPALRHTMKLSPALRLSRPDLARVERTLRSIMAEQDTAEPGYHFAMRGHFINLLSQLVRAYPRDAAPPAVRGDFARLHRLAGVLGFMEAGFSEPLRIADLARRAHLSESAFSRLFKKAIGLTPGEHLIRLRVQHAGQLLLSTAWPVAAVAVRSGFDDPNYFARQFRRITGVPPTEFRRAGNFRQGAK